MPLFTARLERIKPTHKNPFKMSMWSPMVNTTTECREWDIEADNKEQVQQFYNEAKAENHPNVRGFDLVSIIKNEDI